MKTKHTAKSVLTLVLAVCMVVALLPMSVFAVSWEKTTINYVALGASNVNGFGLQGYLPDTVTGPDDYATENVYGYQRETMAYPYQLATLINDELGYNVSVNQLAISSMRAEELRVLLDDSYDGDAYTRWRFTAGDNWFNRAHTNGLTGLRKDYQNYIAKADLITVDIGLNNFGVYLSNEIQALADPGESFGNNHDVSSIDPDIAEQYQLGVAYVKELIAQYAPEFTPVVEQYDEIVDVLAYALIGFCVNFDASMARIYELNPDATVIAVSIQNMVPDITAFIAGEELPMGDICGALTQAANLYMMTGSPYSSKYLYTDLRADGAAHVEYFITELANYSGNAKDLSDNMVDCFTLYDSDLSEGLALAKTTAQSALSTLYDEAKTEAAAFDVYATILQYAATYSVCNMDTIFTGWDTAFETFATLLLNEVTAAVAAIHTQLNYNYELSETFKQTVEGSPALQTLLAMGVRISIGNAFFGHPTENGHAEIANAVLTTLQNDITGTDTVLGYADRLATELLAIVKPYGVNAITALYNYLDENYISEVNEFTEAVEAFLARWEGYITAAGTDPAALAEACKKIADEVMTLIDTYQLVDQADAILNAVQTAVDVLNAIASELGDEFIDAFGALMETYGKPALDELYAWAVEMGYVEDMENFKEQIGIWKDQLESAMTREGFMALAEEIWNYLVEEGIISENDITEAIEWVNDLIDFYVNYVKDTVQNILDEAEKAGIIEEATLESVVDLMLDLKRLAEEVPGEIETMIEDILHDAANIAYLPYEDTNYLALGSDTAAGYGTDAASYYEMLVNALFTGEARETLNSAKENTVETELLINGIFDYVKEQADDIAEADWITYQMDAAHFGYAALSGATPEWDKYLTAEQYAFAEELLAKAIAEYASDIDPETMKLIRPYVENFVFAMVSYAVDTVKSIDYMRELNEDAEIVIVGMYNSFRDFVINADGEMIPVGDMFEYVIEATNLYHKVCATIYENVAFVDVSDTAVKGIGEISIAMDDLLNGNFNFNVIAKLYNASNVYANEEGHEYIYTQIMNAVDFLGDMNEDGVIDAEDVTILKAFVLNASDLPEEARFIADINQDGEVTVTDIALLYYYVTLTAGTN